MRILPASAIPLLAPKTAQFETTTPPVDPGVFTFTIFKFQEVEEPQRDFRFVTIFPFFNTNCLDLQHMTIDYRQIFRH